MPKFCLDFNTKSNLYLIEENTFVNGPELSFKYMGKMDVCAVAVDNDRLVKWIKH